MLTLERVAAIFKSIEHPRYRRVINRPFFIVRDQILLADISNIAVFSILSEQMIKWLITARTNVFGDCRIPFFAIGKNGIDIKHNTAKFEHAVADNFANAKAGMGD